MENKKKTRGFVETPKVIVDLMHLYLGLTSNEVLADFTAWRGQLFGSHPANKCVGIELDDDNYHLVSRTYENILHGDIFDLIDDIPEVDALVLNPPYIKTSNEMISRSLGRLKDGGRFAIISKDTTLRKLKEEYPDLSVHIDMAMCFDTNLFKPFAQVKTVLLFGQKGKEQWEYYIYEFSNNEIVVNTRSKIVEPKILKPKTTINGSTDFWEKLNEQSLVDTIPTLQDFVDHVTAYMAFDTGFPVEFFRNPKKLWDAYAKLRNYQNK